MQGNHRTCHLCCHEYPTNFGNCGGCFGGSLSKAVTTIAVNSHDVNALIDTGSTDNYISPRIVQDLGLHVYQSGGQVTMAATNCTSAIQGYSVVEILMQGHHYRNIKLSVLPNLCSDVLLGHDFLRLCDIVSIKFGGSKAPLTLCGLSTLAVSPPLLLSLT